MVVHALAKLSTIWGEEAEKKYLPWMNYAITEAQAMNGITECIEPLYSKGSIYHQQGGHYQQCPCGSTTHPSNCEPPSSAWCASFANWCLRQSNTAYTKSAGSQTFLNHSEFVKISEPIFGALAVFSNINSKGEISGGHVTFVVGLSGNIIYGLGGNQSQMIKVSEFTINTTKIPNTKWFRGYFIPKSYLDKTNNYKTTILTNTDIDAINLQIINLNINSSNNESTN